MESHSIQQTKIHQATHAKVKRPYRSEHLWPMSSRWDKWCKKLVLNTLNRFEYGQLIIRDGEGEYPLGCVNQNSSDLSNSDSLLVARINIEHPAVYRQMVLGGSVGAAEAFMVKEWTTPCLVDVVRVFARNLSVLNGMEGRWSGLSSAMNKFNHYLNANTPKGSRRNIAAHYDLGNDFFGLFLDPSMMYSSAIFPEPTASLDQASWHKCDLICRKLDLQPTDHLVEIGTGWGGMAIHAAKHYGCKVTTTTLSKEQRAHAIAWIEQEGLQDRITVLLEDYRELQGQFDKLVSVEMIEAVGHEYYDTYFAKCSSLLKPNGKMLIQAITIADQRYESAKRSVDFIQKYIFPGGCLPSNAVMTSCVNRCTDMMLVDLHDIGLDYALTLEQWRLRFKESLQQVKEQGFNDTFCRMWEYYLAYCEGGFRERSISTVQVVMAKPQAKVGHIPHQ